MSVVITREDIIAYAEVDYIINHMDDRYVEKVPEKLLNFFEKIKDPNHKINIDPYKPLNEQGLQKYTLEIIALLHLKYWCENEERKKELYDLMLKNQRKLEEQMRQKFSIDNLFDDNSIKKVKEESDLEGEDFSKPKAVQYYSQYTESNDDIQDYTDVVDEEDLNKNKNEQAYLESEENLPEKVEKNTILSKVLGKILNLFRKKENKE